MNFSLFGICNRQCTFRTGAQTQTNQCGKKGFRGTGACTIYRKDQANGNQFAQTAS